MKCVIVPLTLETFKEKFTNPSEKVLKEKYDFTDKELLYEDTTLGEGICEVYEMGNALDCLIAFKEEEERNANKQKN